MSTKQLQAGTVIDIYIHCSKLTVSEVKAAQKWSATNFYNNQKQCLGEMKEFEKIVWVHSWLHPPWALAKYKYK